MTVTTDTSDPEVPLVKSVRLEPNTCSFDAEVAQHDRVFPTSSCAASQAGLMRLPANAFSRVDNVLANTCAPNAPTTRAC